MHHQDYQRIEQAIRFLQEQAREQPPLEEVAEHVGLSPFHFQRLFKSWAGVSPKRFVQYLTIEHAKQRLRESASVLDAALDVGLSGPGRLHDLFISVEAITPGEYKTRGKDLQIDYGFHATPFGECLLATTIRGVCNLGFVEPGGRDQALTELQQAWRESSLVENQARGAGMIDRIFTPQQSGDQDRVQLLLRGTNFQLKVWDALLRIPEGRVISYAALADSIGHPAAHRAVGTAVGHNPVAYLIPCHRVLRANGGVGGYRWGVHRKQAILAREAAISSRGL